MPPSESSLQENDSFSIRYKILGEIGEGSYSKVLKCRKRESGEIFACKRLKHSYRNWAEVSQSSEIITLRKLDRHLNILQMTEIHFDPSNGRVSLVFELMDMNLYELIKDKKKPLPEARVKNMIFQLIRALRHLHRNGIFHRDVKPENILLKKGQSPDEDILKLGDLGSVRGLLSRPPYTDYISTRWYRSPECLLSSGYYGIKMDIWATGCVFYEIMTLRPLFPGSSEIDQINKIHSIVGPPPPKTLEKFTKQLEEKIPSHRTNKIKRIESIKKTLSELSCTNSSRSCDWYFNSNSSISHGNNNNLSQLLPSSISPEAKELMLMLLEYDPDLRPTAQKALNHPYFKGLRERARKLSSIAGISQDEVIVTIGTNVKKLSDLEYDPLILKTLGDSKIKKQLVESQLKSTSKMPHYESSSKTSLNSTLTKIPVLKPQRVNYLTRKEKIPEVIFKKEVIQQKVEPTLKETSPLVKPQKLSSKINSYEEFTAKSKASLPYEIIHLNNRGHVDSDRSIVETPDSVATPQDTFDIHKLTKPEQKYGYNLRPRNKINLEPPPRRVKKPESKLSFLNLGINSGKIMESMEIRKNAKELNNNYISPMGRNKESYSYSNNTKPKVLRQEIYEDKSKNIKEKFYTDVHKEKFYPESGKEKLYKESRKEKFYSETKKEAFYRDNKYSKDFGGKRLDSWDSSDSEDYRRERYLRRTRYSEQSPKEPTNKQFSYEMQKIEPIKKQFSYELQKTREPSKKQFMFEASERRHYEESRKPAKNYSSLPQFSKTILRDPSYEEKERYLYVQSNKNNKSNLQGKREYSYRQNHPDYWNSTDTEQEAEDAHKYINTRRYAEIRKREAAVKKDANKLDFEDSNSRTNKYESSPSLKKSKYEYESRDHNRGGAGKEYNEVVESQMMYDTRRAQNKYDDENNRALKPTLRNYQSSSLGTMGNKILRHNNNTSNEFVEVPSKRFELGSLSKLPRLNDSPYGRSSNNNGIDTMRTRLRPSPSNAYEQQRNSEMSRKKSEMSQGAKRRYGLLPQPSPPFKNEKVPKVVIHWKFDK